MELRATDKEFQFPVIETGRLILRKFESADLDSVEQLFNDDEVQKYLLPENRRNREQLQVLLKNFALRWQERGFGIWCVCEKDTGEMIGYCGFQLFDKTPEIELVFAYHKDFWGRGFATEAANACLQFGFAENQFERIFAATHLENRNSRYVLRKIGMSFCRTTGHYSTDLITFCVSRENYTASENFYSVISEPNAARLSENSSVIFQ